MKMEQTECSETSAYKIQTPGNYPEESIKLLDFITLIPTGEQYQSCSCALCSFLCLPLISSFSATNFLLST